MKRLLLASTLLFAAHAAHATLSLTVLDNGLAVTGTTINNPGSLTFTGTDPAFTALTVSITGVPAIPSPDLGTVSVLAHTGPGTGSHILTVEALQSGLTGFVGGNMSTTFTANSLIGSPGPTNMSMLFDGTNIASHSFPVGTAVDTFQKTSALGAVAGPFTDEQDLTTTFTGASQLLQTSAQFKAVATPEPAAIGVFGIGLLGVLLAKRRWRVG